MVITKRINIMKNIGVQKVEIGTEKRKKDPDLESEGGVPHVKDDHRDLGNLTNSGMFLLLDSKTPLQPSIRLC